jgi:modulator of FtsH protease HflK
MSDEHEHPKHESAPVPGGEPAAPSVDDASSRALDEAFRSSFFIVRILMVALVLIFLGSGIRTIGPQERAVILRFGRPVGQGKDALLGPGMHWAFPAPIDEVRRIPYSEIQTVNSTVGWYYLTPEEQAGVAAGSYVPQGMNRLDPARDSYTITGDGNIIHVRATVSYRVDDPIRYEFGIANASNAVQDALDDALIYASARFTNVDDVLRFQRDRFRETVTARLEDLIHQEDLGISLVQSPPVEEVPPLYLKPYFDRVTDVQNEAEKERLTAESERNNTTNTAAAEAVRRVSAAEAEQTNLVASIQADAGRFEKLLPEYEANPQLVRNILYLQTVSNVLANVSDKWYLPQNPGGEPWEIRLQLNRPPLEPAPAAVNTNIGQNLQ